MWINRIQLKNFRNYSSLDLNLDPGVVVFIGNNAQGKSNFLEAISLLLSGESFRQAHSSDFILSENIKPGSGSNFAAIRGTIKKGSRGQESVNTVEFRTTGHKNQLLLNNKKIGKGTLAKSFGLVTFSPESLSAIKQGPAERRELLDDILVSLEPAMVDLIHDFNRELKTRNRVLKDIQEGKIDKSEGLILLESIDESYIRDATNLTYHRISTARQIQPFIQRVVHQVFNPEIVEISVDYLISEHTAIAWDRNQVYDSISCRIKDLRLAEIASGQSLVGPHKHDVKFLFNGRDSRFYCSQGQQRAIALAFKIAQIEALKLTFGEDPILVLDDVLSELDAKKQKNLVEQLQVLSGQIFLSSTDLDHVELIQRPDLHVYNVINGIISQQG